MHDELASENIVFDFKAHGQEAVSEYLGQRDFFLSLAQAVQRIVQECLKRREVRVNSVDFRAKDAASFEKKASRPSDDDPDVPKYNDPLRQITDLAGVRIITFFPDTLGEIDQMLTEEFELLERSDKRKMLIEEERFGYQSVHYLVRLKEQRSRLPEYAEFRDATVEIQVRTFCSMRGRKSNTIFSTNRRRSFRPRFGAGLWL